MFRRQLITTSKQLFSVTAVGHQQLFTRRFTGALATAAATGGLYLCVQKRFLSPNKQILAAEEPSVSTTTTTSGAPEVKKPYQGTPPEVDDTFRYVLTENPLSKVLEGKSVKDLDITLYQYQVCPFCCKVRTFLDYNKIPYKIVEVNPVLKTEVKFSKDYKKVPIVLVNGLQINDSSIIISALNDLLVNNDSKKQRVQPDAREVQWRKWVDHKLVHTLPPNIYRSPQEAMDAFEYISEMNHFSWYQKAVAKYAGSMAMWGVSKKLKKKHGIEDERAAIFDCANEWMEELQGQAFHGGNKVDLADLAAYGVLSSIEGLQTFNEMLQATKIGSWYYRVKKEVGDCSGKR